MLDPFAHLRSDPAHAQAEAKVLKFPGSLESAQIVLQTLGKPASRLQSLDRDLKVPIKCAKVLAL